MPTYGYRCTECKHEFQVFQAMKENPIAICPECKGAVKRLLYPVGIVFKGSGWYINDSRKPEVSSEDTAEAKSDNKLESAVKPADSSKSETSKSDTAKGDTTKSESKPAPDKTPVSAAS